MNEEIRALCPLNSAATIVFSEREDSDDPKLLERIGQAEAIFIAGGDQSNYVRFWQDTPVEDALNRHIAAGKPIGGSSAGLAVLGEFSFSSMIDTIHSPDALADPYGNKVTISRDFLRIPLLAGIITDTHFRQAGPHGPPRRVSGAYFAGWMGRSRCAQSRSSKTPRFFWKRMAKRRSSALVPAYFLEVKNSPEVCQRKVPLSFSGITVHRAPSGASFNVKDWNGTGGDDYQALGRKRRAKGARFKSRNLLAAGRAFR